MCSFFTLFLCACAFNFAVNAVKVTIQEPPIDSASMGSTVDADLTSAQFGSNDDEYEFCGKVASIVDRIKEFGPKCRVFTKLGVLLSDLVQLDKLTEELVGEKDRVVLYVVAKFGQFIWPTGEVGSAHKLEWPTVDGNSIEMETLSTSPPIFQLHNFVNEAEIDALIAKANSVTLERSTGGLQKQGASGANQGNVIDARTSTNAWEEYSDLAVKIKKRGFDVLRIPFNLTWVDGLQMVHYDPGQYYMPHTDFFDIGEESTGVWNFDPSTGGSNRIATIFIYLSDVEMGGNTAFPRAQPPNTTHTDERKAEVNRLKDELWPGKKSVQKFVDNCEDKWFGVPPKKGDAILFYSINSNGKLDTKAQHAACPVLKGEKWGANMWYWSGVYFTQDRLQKMKEGKSLDDGPMNAVFKSRLKTKSFSLNWVSFDKSLVLQDSVLPGGVFHSNTHIGHKFAAYIDGIFVKEWEMFRSSTQYSITEEDLISAGINAIGSEQTKEEL